MALQIRRGTTAERTARRFLEGELIYDTVLQQVFVGDSVDGTTGTLGGKAVTAFTQEDAQDAIRDLFAAGSHGNISFSYNDVGNSISATVNLSNYNGTITATSFKGSVFGDDSTLLVDAANGLIPAEVVTGTFTGSVIGNVTGDVSGNAGTADVADRVALTATDSTATEHFITFSEVATGNEIVRTDTSLTYNPSTNTLTAGTFSGAFSGTLTGNVVTSNIDSSDSSAITVVPSVNFNSNITVENILNAPNLNATGKADFTVTDDTAAVVFRPTVLNLKANCFNTSSSGPAIDFRVESDLDGPFYSGRIIGFRDTGDSGTLEIRMWDPTLSDVSTIATFNAVNGTQFEQIVAFSNGLNIAEQSVSSSIGSDGDVAGDFRVGDISGTKYIFYCVADYDGVSDIWVRMPFIATPW